MIIIKPPIVVRDFAEQMKLNDKTLPIILAAVFFGVSVVFVYRSFYGMRIQASDTTAADDAARKKAAAEA